MADGSNGSGGGDVVDCPKDAGGTMEVETEDQTVTVEAPCQGAPVIEGKGVVEETEETTEAPTRPVEFRPVVGSSGHKPIIKDDCAEFVDDATLNPLLKDNPTVVATIIAALEE
ncbi:hypothetical protein RHMOL_Rhmol01G0147100 [Rhododendron molle]|uniref:Uncharacterized protein n=1 Tax=Rhododendron molle TaxID=49168 RepID=A0ACC0Q485_RHOML|nr:hypothetical protein RHMOL_Rhmol01G0147100 [Rhododendron molle]